MDPNRVHCIDCVYEGWSDEMVDCSFRRPDGSVAERWRCPECQEEMYDEAVSQLLARVDDAEMIDLGALAIAASRPWTAGEPERAA